MFGSPLNIGNRNFNTPNSGGALPSDGADVSRWSYLDSGQVAWTTSNDVFFVANYPVSSNNTFVELIQVRFLAFLFDGGGTTRYSFTNSVYFSVSFPQNSNSQVLYFGNNNGQALNVIVSKLTNGTIGVTWNLYAGDLLERGFIPDPGSYVTFLTAIQYR